MNSSETKFEADFDIAAAVNDEAVLSMCLRRSPDIVAGAAQLRTYVNFSTAGAAYNQALSEASAEYLVLVHQDVYLPKGFLENLKRQLDFLSAQDPDWAVAGSVGLDEAGVVQGMVWCSGNNRVIGSRPKYPMKSICIDELLIVIRRSKGLRFDEYLPSFHMYGTDIILEASKRRLSSYIVDAPVVHHSRAVVTLRGQYHEAYRYMRNKWRLKLPIQNLICPVYSNSLVLYWRDFQIRRQHRGTFNSRPEPKGDPVAIARGLGFET